MMGCPVCGKDLSGFRRNGVEHVSRCRSAVVKIEKGMERIKSGDVCDFGCGNIALYVFKNGKICCSKTSSLCSQMRNRNSKSHLGKKHGWKSGWPKGRPSPFKGMKYEEMFGQKKSLEIKKRHAAKMALVHNTVPLTEEGKRLKSERLSKIAKERNYGGYKKGSGRGKKGWYNGIWCDSSWELAWLIFCFEHGIRVRRNRKRFTYDWKGSSYKYLPDFIVEDNLIVEVKGYMDERAKVKIASCPGVIVLMKDEMKVVIDYVVMKYGRDFIRLYQSGRV